MFEDMTAWFNSFFEEEGMEDGPSTDVKSQHPDSKMSSEQLVTDVTADMSATNLDTSSVEASSAAGAMSSLPMGLGGLFSEPLNMHMSEMAKFESEQAGITEKLNAESAIGSAEREKPLAALQVETQVQSSIAQDQLNTAMTGREGGVNEQQIKAEGARESAAVEKEIENKQQQALSEVYNAEYGRILQTEINNIEVPGRFLGYF